MDAWNSSICFYCDHSLKSDVLNCSFCGADIHDIRSYAKNHQDSLEQKNLKNIDGIFKTNWIMKSLEDSAKHHSHIGSLDTSVVSTNTDSWICNKCGYQNSTSSPMCDQCLTSTVDDYVVVNSDYRRICHFNEVQMSIMCSESNLDVEENHYDPMSPSKKSFVQAIENYGNWMSKTYRRSVSEPICGNCKGSIEGDVFCKACMNAVARILKWKCENCAHINDFPNEMCD